MTGIQIRLQDGASHQVDSTEMAFLAAGEGAMRQVMEDGSWSLLEPVMQLEVSAPVEYQGVVCSTLARRNALITATETTPGADFFTAFAEVSFHVLKAVFCKFLILRNISVIFTSYLKHLF